MCGQATSSITGGSGTSRWLTWTVLWSFTQHADAASNRSSSCGPWRTSTARQAASVKPSAMFRHSRMVMPSHCACDEVAAGFLTFITVILQA